MQPSNTMIISNPVVEQAEQQEEHQEEHQEAKTETNVEVKPEAIPSNKTTSTSESIESSIEAAIARMVARRSLDTTTCSETDDAKDSDKSWLDLPVRPEASGTTIEQQSEPVVVIVTPTKEPREASPQAQSRPRSPQMHCEAPVALSMPSLDQFFELGCSNENTRTSAPQSHHASPKLAKTATEAKNKSSENVLSTPEKPLPLLIDSPEPEVIQETKPVAKKKAEARKANNSKVFFLVKR